MHPLPAFLEVVEIRRGAFLEEAGPRGHVFEGHSLFLVLSCPPLSASQLLQASLSLAYLCHAPYHDIQTHCSLEMTLALNIT